MRLLSVFVLYHPDLVLLEKGISEVAQYVDHILLWENSVVDHHLFADAPFCRKIEWTGSGSNEGISAALNFAWKYAAREGYDYLLTMDQDSVFLGFRNFLDNIRSSHEPLGIYGPGVNWMAFSGSLYRYDFLITSGMLIPVSILNQLAGFRSDFKVDGIDLDLTLRAKETGIPTYLVGDCALLQRYGVSKSRKVIFKQFSISSYSSERLYSIYRNLQILLVEHPDLAWKRHYRQMWGIRNIAKRILVEDDRRSTFKSILKGIRDGKRVASAKAS